MVYNFKNCDQGCLKDKVIFVIKTKQFMRRLPYFHCLSSNKFPSFGLITCSIDVFCELYNLMNSSDLCTNLKLQGLECVYN